MCEKRGMWQILTIYGQLQQTKNGREQQQAREGEQSEFYGWEVVRVYETTKVSMAGRFRQIMLSHFHSLF